MLGVCFSSRRDVFVTASIVNPLRLWEYGACSQTGFLNGDHGPVAAVRFSPDGSLLVSGNGRGNVSVWDVESGTKRAGLHMSSYVSSVLFCDAGKTLVACSLNGAVRRWSLYAGDEKDLRIEEKEPICIIPNVGVEGLDLSRARIDSVEDRQVFRQNGVKV